MSKTFTTGEVLAAMHAFPAILAARENTGIIEAFDKLRNISPEMAGVDAGRDQLGWIDLAGSLKPALGKYFSALAAEKVPDPDYWNAPATVDPVKVERLGQWVRKMEQKYGATQQVPDLSATIAADMKKKDSIRAKVAGKTLTI